MCDMAILTGYRVGQTPVLSGHVAYTIKTRTKKLPQLLVYMAMLVKKSVLSLRFIY